MRKVTEKASQALRNNQSYKSGNTEVLIQTRQGINGDYVMTIMRLHGNTIAKLVDKELEIQDCGWQSATTKERLNGILSAFDLPYTLWQHDSTWYLRDKHGNNNVWAGSTTFEVVL